MKKGRREDPKHTQMLINNHFFHEKRRNRCALFILLLFHISFELQKCILQYHFLSRLRISNTSFTSFCKTPQPSNCSTSHIMKSWSLFNLRECCFENGIIVGRSRINNSEDNHVEHVDKFIFRQNILENHRNSFR